MGGPPWDAADSPIMFIMLRNGFQPGCGSPGSSLGETQMPVPRETRPALHSQPVPKNEQCSSPVQQVPPHL
jgi:hypothetical protein